MAAKIPRILIFSEAVDCREDLSTQGVQNLSEITLSLVVFKMNDIYNSHQNPRWQLENSKEIVKK